MSSTFIGKYAFRERDIIGTGQFGKVYKGYHIDTKEWVAIKAIPKSILQDTYFKNVYNNEVGSLSKLKSPYIVKLLGIQAQYDKIYIITEFCEGGDLSSYLVRRKRLPENEVIDILWQIVQAFKEMKKYNLLHRDLKPANILLTKGGVKVADLGFSKAVNSFQDSIAKSYVGSPIYMAPQILFKQIYTSKADVWSLGIMLYQLIYGDVPWNAVDINELSHQVRTQPIFFRMNIPISRELVDLITRCTKYEERDRISWDEIFIHPAVTKSSLNQQISQPQAPSQVVAPVQTQAQAPIPSLLAKGNLLAFPKQPQIAKLPSAPQIPNQAAPVQNGSAQKINEVASPGKREFEWIGQNLVPKAMPAVAIPPNGVTLHQQPQPVPSAQNNLPMQPQLLTLGGVPQLGSLFYMNQANGTKTQQPQQLQPTSLPQQQGSLINLVGGRPLTAAPTLQKQAVHGMNFQNPGMAFQQPGMLRPW